MGWFLLPYFIQCFFYSLLFHFPSYTSSSLCNHDDSSAMLQFKNSFAVNTSASEHWFLASAGFPINCFFSNKTASWENVTDCCQWAGVTCDTMSGHVISLDLSCSMLQGEFHPNSTLFQLTHLQRLNLAFNDFSGSSIYSGIGDLVNLTHLNLSFSGFGGDIPSTISHLSKLESLDISSHFLDNMSYDFLEDIWSVVLDPSTWENSGMRLDPSTWKKLILNATNLRELNLDGIDMSSIRQSSLPLLMNLSSSLVSLTLAATRLQGNLPSDILCLPNLQELKLSLNRNLGVRLPNSNWSTPLRFLDLSVTAFSGPIPDSIGHLRSLNYLSLAGNSLQGEIPSSLSNLKHLAYLGLESNNFSGHIPDVFGKFIKLEYLTLSNNSLGGQLPSSLFDLTQLLFLDLSSNKLVGPIPSEVTNLSNLKILGLDHNLLNGIIPRWCYSLPSLVLLDLSENQFTGSISEFSTYSLEYLDLSSNKLLNIDNSVDHILPNLEHLDLSSCNINNFPKFLSQVHNLQHLDLSNNKIHGEIPESFFLSWRNIQYIDLSFNKLQGDLPIPPYGTHFFSVSNNNFTGGISSTMCNASSLSVLNLSHNNLTGMIPQCLGTFPSLVVLDLQMNNLYGSIPRDFSDRNSFETIKLNNNQLEGPLPRTLAHCTKLEVLDLGDNNMEDTFPSWLETLQELQVLILRANKFHGIITCDSSKHQFPKLRIFDVSNNHLSGPLPASCIKNFQEMMNVNYSQTGLKYMESGTGLYNESVVVIMKGQYMELVRILTTFTTIDLSNNMFEGEIPEVIGELNSLIGLNLSHNGISGTIPQYLSNLRNLEWLDLSWNQLTGEIPMALTNLNFLSTLNLSQNQFEGMIPRGGQFDTFQNDSYEGNPMLCGFPLSKSCNKDEKWPPHSTEESGFGWKAVTVGYACGVVFGMLLGCVVFLTRKPQWLARLVGDMPDKR